jgi:polyhydroxybutyrate depolymerase
MKPMVKYLVAGLLACPGIFTPRLADAAADGSCAVAGLGPGIQSVAVLSSGLTRSVRVFVPAAAKRGAALPLIIDLHGSGGNGEGQARVSRLSDLAGREGFVVANPSGGVALPNAPNEHYWNIPGVPLTSGAATPADAPDDVRFIADILDQIARQTCIDPRRIYVTGMSGGGRMTSLLACRLSTRIAAVAPVSGLRAGLPSERNPAQPDPATCQPQRAVPIVTFHGTGDSVNPFEGSGTLRWGYGIPTALHRWAEIDHCQGQPRERRVSAHVTLVRYSPCADGAEVWLYRTDAPGSEGGGHAWPGSVSSAAPAAVLASEQLRNNVPGTEINASELMWQFFKAHPLPVHTGTP